MATIAPEDISIEAVDYDRLDLSWSNPEDGWDTMILVRSSAGAPVTPDQGTEIARWDTVDPLTSFQDTGLVGGTHAYYTIFYRDGVGPWIPHAEGGALVIRNTGFQRSLWEWLPSMYRAADEKLAVDGDGPLRRYLSLPAYELDVIRTEYEHLLAFHDPAVLSDKLIFHLAHEFGVELEPYLGMQISRKLLANIVSLYKRKGTMHGSEAFVEILTGWPTTGTYDSGTDQTLWDITSASHVSSFSVADEEDVPTSVDFSPDGTKMFITGANSGSVHRYDLSTPWDATSASFVSSHYVRDEEYSPTDVTFAPDGTKMFVIGPNSRSVHRYDLSTPWDVTSASFIASFSVEDEEYVSISVTFAPDGTKMFITGHDTDSVHRYDLSTPWDVTSASHVSSFSVAGKETGPFGVTFSPDGTKMFVIGQSSDSVHRYDLSTPWDVTSSSFVSSFSVEDEETTPSDVAFSPDGTKMFVTGGNSDSVHRYDFLSLVPPSTGTVTFSVLPNRRNLIPNPSYEDGLQGWAANNDTDLSQSSDWSFAGDYSAKLVLDNGAAGNVLGMYLPDEAGLPYAVYGMTPYGTGKFYSVLPPGGVEAALIAYDLPEIEELRNLALSTYVYSSHARTTVLQVNWHNADKVVIGSAKKEITTQANAATRVSLVAQAPVGTEYISVALEIRGVTSNDVHYVDGWLLEESSSIRDYFDGDTDSGNDTLWEANAHESPSRYYYRRVLKEARLADRLPDFLPLGVDYVLDYGTLS